MTDAFVRRFERSSLYLARLCHDGGTTFAAKFALPESEYAAAGGAFPLRVHGAGVVGWFGVSGLPGDPAYPPDTEDAPMPPLPIGAAGDKVARAHTKLGWHWWPEFNSINSTPYDGRRPCVQRSTCQSGCNEAVPVLAGFTRSQASTGELLRNTVEAPSATVAFS